MKRELKVWSVSRTMLATSVTAAFPMKRELKEIMTDSGVTVAPRNSSIPYEEGTESQER